MHRSPYPTVLAFARGAGEEPLPPSVRALLAPFARARLA